MFFKAIHHKVNFFSIYSKKQRIETNKPATNVETCLKDLSYHDQKDLSQRKHWKISMQDKKE